MIAIITGGVRLVRVWHRGWTREFEEVGLVLVDLCLLLTSAWKNRPYLLMLLSSGASSIELALLSLSNLHG